MLRNFALSRFLRFLQGSGTKQGNAHLLASASHHAMEGFL